MDYQPENFGAHDAYTRQYAASPARACEAARRALLSQGFVVDTADQKQVAGHKYFQPDSNHNVQLTFHVSCAAQGEDAGGGTMVFASGLQDQYSLRKTKESASVGVGVLGSLSLPLEGGSDTMVKVASATVKDDALYQGFFDLVDKLLQSGEVPDTPSPPVATTVPVPDETHGTEPVQTPSAAASTASTAASAALAAPASEAASAAMPEQAPFTTPVSAAPVPVASSPAQTASEAVPALIPVEVPHAAPAESPTSAASPAVPAAAP
jgi:hypothetical protein